MTVYIRFKSDPNMVNRYEKVKSIGWVNNTLMLFVGDNTEFQEVYLRDVESCEVM